MRDPWERLAFAVVAQAARDARDGQFRAFDLPGVEPWCEAAGLDWQRVRLHLSRGAQAKRGAEACVQDGQLTGCAGSA